MKNKAPPTPPPKKPHQNKKQNPPNPVVNGSLVSDYLPFSEHKLVFRSHSALSGLEVVGRKAAGFETQDFLALLPLPPGLGQTRLVFWV